LRRPLCFETPSAKSNQNTGLGSFRTNIDLKKAQFASHYYKAVNFWTGWKNKIVQANKIQLKEEKYS